MSINRSTSILAVDFGNIHTRAILIDLVDGVYSLVAQSQVRTTGGFPIGNVNVGLVRALQQITQSTGRKMIDLEGKLVTPEQADRSGVDTFVATASLGRPLRTVVIGLYPEMSIASALRATAGTYVQVVDTLSLTDQRTSEEHLNAIVLARPDLIFIVGGVEEGAEKSVLRMAEIARLAVRLLPGDAKPTVLFAGNQMLVPAMQRLFKDLTSLLVTDNVRPTLESESTEGAQLQLALAYDRFTERRGLGFDAVGNMSELGVLPNAQSYSLIAEYIGKTEGNALIVDVGSGVSTLAASVEGVTSTGIRTDIGLGYSAEVLLNIVGIDAIKRWIPFPCQDDEILTYVLNKSLRPAFVPETLRGMYFEHALLRAAITESLSAVSPLWQDNTTPSSKYAPMPVFERVIGAGAALANTGRHGLAAMLLLDTVMPTGVSVLQIDSRALLPAIGALAHVNPEAVVQLLDATGLDTLGTAVSISGSPRGGKTCAQVIVRHEDGTKEKHQILGGQLWIYDLPIGLHATITVQVKRGLDIAGKRKVKLEVEGGLAGFIVDARGRALSVSDNVNERSQQIPEWYAQATGDPVRQVIVDTFQPLADVPSTPTKPEKANKASAKPKKERRARRGRKEDPVAEVLPPAQKQDDEIDDLRNLLS